MAILGLWLWGRNIREMNTIPITSHHIKGISICLTMLDADLDHLTEVLLPIVKLFFFFCHHSHTVLFRIKSLYTTHT